MRTPLAWRNVQHGRMRSLAALAGVSFAILLIFMQLGFRSAAERSATLIFESLDFDLLVVSPQYMFLARPRSFAPDLLWRLQALPEVATVVPLQLGWGEWRNPDTGLAWGMLVLGVDPGRPPFQGEGINRLLPLLTVDDTVLIDTRTRPEYGPQRIGLTAEMARHRLRIVGRYTIGAGFVANGSIITSQQTFARVFGTPDRPGISLGLLKLRPGSSAEEAARRASAILAPMARVVTRTEMEASERHYWLSVKPIGIMFTSGVLVAFVVGSVILHQVLASEIQNRLREYATLKAIGHGTAAVYGVVVRQGLIFAVIGFVPACLAALVLYALLRQQAFLPVEMPWPRLVGVLGLSCGMCLLACLLAIQKLKRADPADLF